MTVKQLINELSKIQDKTKEIEIVTIQEEILFVTAVNSCPNCAEIVAAHSEEPCKSI